MDIGYAGALVGGVLSLLSPCSVMLLPAFFAYAFTSPAKLLARTAVFTLGLMATLVPLGVFSGVLGSLLTQHRGMLIAVVAGLVIVVGALQLLGVPLPGIARTDRHSADRTSALSVFLLGSVYAVAGVCTGPILGSVLMVASLGGSPAYGAALLAIYALGMALPLLVLALVWRSAGTVAMRWLRPRMLHIGRWQNSWTSIITGALSIGLGVLLLVTDGTASLGSIVGVGTQFELESAAGSAAAGVPDWLFATAACLALAAVAAAVFLRGRDRAARASGPGSAKTEQQRATRDHAA